MVELSPPLLFWVSCHICHQLKEQKYITEHKEPQLPKYRKGFPLPLKQNSQRLTYALPINFSSTEMD